MWQHITKPMVVAIAAPLFLGQIVGAIQGTETLDWFKILKKPSWCPPIPAFPIVWTTLYCFMGYASYLVWTYGGFDAQSGPLLIYALQLLLNLAWPLIFFKQKKLKLAMVENLALLVTASLTANSFWRVDRLAGKLMIPYIIWLVLANALNFNILSNNPSGDEDPRRENLYKSEDKRNPGEQGYYPAKPASAALGKVSSRRDRGRLVVYAQRTPTPPSATVRAPRPSVRPTVVQRPSMALRSARFALV
jgi:tryptophan-rich sensory protein